MKDAKVQPEEKTPLVTNHHEEDNSVSTLQLMTNEKARDRVYYLLCFISFIDIIGPLMVVQGLPALLGAQEKYPNQAYPVEYIPVKFLIAKTLTSAAGALGGFLCNSIIITRADLLGLKRTLLLFMFGGSIVFLSMYFLANVNITGGAAFYLLLLCKFLAGFLGGSISTAKLIVQSIYQTPKTQIKKLTQMMPIPVFGVAIGSMFGGVFITVTNLLLSPALVASAISLIGGLLVLKFVPYIPKRIKKEKKEDHYKRTDEKSSTSTATDSEPYFDKSTYNKVLLATFFDSLGTNGLKCAMGIVLLKRYKDFVNFPHYYSMAFSFLIFWIAIGMFLGIASLKKRGPAFNAWFGNLATMLGQILLIIIQNWIAYLAVLYISFAFSIYSNVSYMPMLVQITPAARRAKMQGTLGALNTGIDFVLPIVLSAIAQYTDNVALTICACFSFIGFILSLQLRNHPDFGPPIKKIKMTDDEVTYLKDNPNYMDEEEIEKVNDDRAEKGEGPLTLKWGSWKEDKPYKRLLRKVAHNDFLKFKKKLKRMLKGLKENTAKGAKMEENSSTSWRILLEQHTKGDLKAHSDEMGKWIADYLMDSGHAYTTDPILQKVIIMAAFPITSTPTDGKPFKDLLIERMRWVDHAVELEEHHPDNELTTLSNKFSLLHTM